MKALKGHGVSHISLKQQRRGRPLRASQELILETDAWVIVQELHLRPLRQPIGIQFAPYYDRILKGDLRAIYDYCDRNAPHLEPSFHELLGFLVTIRFYQVANQILIDFERRGGKMGWPSKRETLDYWNRQIKPVCEAARRFIRNARRSGGGANREKLWREYVFHPLPVVRYIHIVGKADQQLLLHSL